MTIAFNPVVQGVEGGWAVFLVGLTAVAAVAVRSARRRPRPALAALARDEEGLSYTLPFLLLVPFYLFFVLTVFEAGLLLLAKIGTLYAAHAGARSAAVWRWANPAELREERIRQAALTALAPFVTTAGSPAGADETLEEQAQDFADVYAFSVSGSRGVNTPRRLPFPLPEDYAPEALKQRYFGAAARTTVTVEGGEGESAGEGEPASEAEKGAEGGDVTVTVSYRAPLHVPLVARFLGREYTITSTATLPGEAPRSEEGTLGIEYLSARGEQP